MEDVIFGDRELDPVRRFLARLSDAGGAEPTATQREARAALRVVWDAQRRSRHARFDATQSASRRRYSFWAATALLCALAGTVLAVAVAVAVWRTLSR